MQDRIQLKREEVVGEGVALSDINPITNAKSVDDDSSGVSLDVTLERIWQAINNSLSRVVNSINGRTGVVVITADDVGLGNVTNVSYATIQEWVVKEMMDQFGVKRLMLFDDESDMNAQMSGWVHDRGKVNVPFYIRHGSVDDAKAYIGYFTWDETTSGIVPVKKAIDTIGFADNSIIYNETINGRQLAGGGIGVNIWSGEDALYIYDESSNNKATSGLAIRKDKIAPELYVFKGLYGADATEGDRNALIYTDNGSTPAADMKKLRININGVTITDPDVYTCYTFKKGDIILTNFSDIEYRDSSGDLNQNVDPLLVCRESMIGSITSVYDPTNAGSAYVIDFYPIKPYVGMGLKYYEVHTADTTNKRSNVLGIDLLTGKMTSAFVDANLSGINVFNAADRARVEEGEPKTNNTVLPDGQHTTQLPYATNSSFISPDFSMNVIPHNVYTGDNAVIENWPSKSPDLSTVGEDAQPKSDQTFLGVNLLKRLEDISGTSKKNAFNMSGLRVVNDAERIYNADIGKSDNDVSDKLNGPGAGSISGGLMVNVGKFLEIGDNVGAGSTAKQIGNYYEGGKVNVRVNELFFKDSDNKLDLNLSHYSSYEDSDPNTVLAGGLTYTPGDDSDPNVVRTPGLTINRGMGLRMSKFDRFGQPLPRYTYTRVEEEPENFDPTQYYKYNSETHEYVLGQVGDTWNGTAWFTRSENTYEDNAFLAVSVFDTAFMDDFSPDPDSHTDEDFIKQGFGGLRYIVSDTRKTNQASAIGLRVNTQQGMNGHALRLGSKAIGIDEQNVVGVQLYRESKKPIGDNNPLNIKNWDEFALYKYIKQPWMKEEVVSTKAFLPTVGDVNTIYYVKEDKDETNSTWISRRYIWTPDPSIEPNHGKYELMFEYYGDYGELPQVGNKNKAYVIYNVDNNSHTIRGELYQWEDAYRIELPESWIPENFDPSNPQAHYDPTYRSPQGVTSAEATAILKYYAISQTSHYKGYYRNGSFWNGPSDASGEMVKVDGKYYEDLSTEKPHMFYIYHSSTDTYDSFGKNYNGSRSLCRQDIIPYDLDHSGTITAVDASIALSYYAAFQASPDKWPDSWWTDSSKTPRDFLAYYLTTYEGVKEYDHSQYVRIRSTSYEGDFIPGLDIDVNEYQGMTTVLNGDIKKSISIKVFDQSAGYENSGPDDIAKLGGLRFTTEGFLSVRVNESNTYNATTQMGRAGADVQSNLLDLEHGKSSGYKGLEQNLGSKGLMVYSNNVLGIQLTHDTRSEMNDNGELCFDEYGSLHISPQYHGGGGGGELLTITDGTTTITYNGSEAKTITLGPGLILEPDNP